MKEVIILGAGAVAAEVCSYIDDINNYAPQKTIVIKGFIDDSFGNFKTNSIKYGFDGPYLGTIDSYNFMKNELLIWGFANIAGRLSSLSKLKEKKIEFLTLCHPNVQIAKTAKIGHGNIIYPNCVIGPNAIIGNNNLITSYSFISHDCVVGNNNFFSTTGLSGNVHVGDNNFFGIRATVLPGVSIGNGNVIQAGMTIDKNVSNNETVYYRYKEKIAFINNDR